VPPGWEVWHALWENADGGTVNPYTKYPMLDASPGQAPVLTTYTLQSGGPKGACAAGNYYSTDLLCYRALQFLDQTDARPFFLYLATSSPHMSAIPPARWKGWGSTMTTPTYPNLNTIPSPNPPAWVPKTPLTADRLAKLSSQFRSMLVTNRAVDDAVDALYDRLAANGRLATTVWVFLSDNGFARGEHRWAEKRCAYEECHRVPFVVVCPPAVCPGAVAGAEDLVHPVLNIDLAPTLADLAGIVPATAVDGRSMVDLLNGTETAWRDGFLQEGFEPITGKPRGFVANWAEDGHDYKYIETLRRTVKQYELYDLTADPWELTNLAGNAAYQAVQSWLAARLAQATAAGD
jgi:arylsulfatase A-like enzyme